MPGTVGGIVGDLNVIYSVCVAALQRGESHLLLLPNLTPNVTDALLRDARLVRPTRS